MIIGGQAVLLYGEPRLTKDIDITLGIDTDRATDVLACADRLGLKVLVENPNEFICSTMVLPVQDAATGIRVDFIFSYSPYEQQAIARAKQMSLAGSILRFASVEDLIIHKIIAGRPRDLEDVKGILLKNKNFDTNYILRWLKDFGIGLEKDFLGCFESILKELK